VVLFPAPLGPTSAVTVPGSSTRDTFRSTAMSGRLGYCPRLRTRVMTRNTRHRESIHLQAMYAKPSHSLDNGPHERGDRARLEHQRHIPQHRDVQSVGVLPEITHSASAPQNRVIHVVSTGRHIHWYCRQMRRIWSR
jgi:hypothetical protein